MNRPDFFLHRGVLSHEIGHMIGLENSRDEKSLMKEISPAKESYFTGEIDEGTLGAYRRLNGEAAKK